MKIYDFPQLSKEWYEIRKLKFTASNASTILAVGKGLNTLIKEMLCEYYSTGAYPDFTARYENVNIKRGHEFEDKAREIYRLETGNIVTQAGFIECDEYTGCSPDGLVNEDGLLEIKNLKDSVFFEYMVSKKIKAEHYNQMQMQMFVSGRKWCDYFVFNPNFNPCYILQRVKPDKTVFKRLETALEYAKNELIKAKQECDELFIAA